jgi:hypothetical protein
LLGVGLRCLPPHRRGRQRLASADPFPTRLAHFIWLPGLHGCGSANQAHVGPWLTRDAATQDWLRLPHRQLFPLPRPAAARGTDWWESVQRLSSLSPPLWCWDSSERSKMTSGSSWLVSIKRIWVLWFRASAGANAK